MLNYIWAGLIVFSLVFALFYDVRDLTRDTYRNGQVLPAEVSFAADAGAIVASLSAAGIAVEETAERVSMPPETMTRKAADMTVLVSCW